MLDWTLECGIKESLIPGGQGLVFLYYVSSARKWTNCPIVPMRPMRPSRLTKTLIESIRPRRNEASGNFQEWLLKCPQSLLWQTNSPKWILLWNQYSLWWKISAVENNEVQREENGTSKQTHVNLVNKQRSDFWFHQVLRCVRVVWSQFWTTSKFILIPEATTNN